MDLLERIMYFSIGGVVGFILGYVVAHLQAIETKVDLVEKEVHEVERTIKPKRDERGAMRLPSLKNVALLIVVALTVFAAFSTARVNGELDHTVQCLTEFNTKQNAALAARDKAIKSETKAEIKLWGLYNRLYREGTLPNTPPERLQELQDILAEAIQNYRLELIDTQKARSEYSYGKPDILENCEERSND